ncbi:MAG TPA: sulfate ABC transporter substrate-binding protein [Solimonas sp.]|nr:sulfate ABC transporter substrate-binding protein [Solimonas sp.]
MKTLSALSLARRPRLRWLPAALALLLSLPAAATDELLNVSYDVARGVYKDLNPAFVARWQAEGNPALRIDQSHGGSAKQARAVIDGLRADVVSMNSPLDIDAIARAGLIKADWATRLPHASSPSWSTILFVVRKGNPRQIRDWNDLVRPGVKVVLPNPKTSGNGRYSYLAAWQYALRQPGGSEARAREFVSTLLRNVPVLDTGGRGATTTFAQRGVGDVLLTFENEVKLIVQEFGADRFEVVVPSLTVRADNPVAVVDRNASRKGSSRAAEAYLRFHFSPEGQEILARNGLRPSDEAILRRHAAQFPAVNLFTIDEAFGGWTQAQKTHFADGGSFDQIALEKR